MQTLTPRKIAVIIIEFIVTEIISFIIQSSISTDNFKNLKMKTIVDNAIIFGTLFIALFVIFQIIYWYIKRLNRFMKQQLVINKYHDIMIVRFEENYRAHICSVLQVDQKLFSKEEFKYLLEYLNTKEKLQIEMKGRNTILGAIS